MIELKLYDNVTSEMLIKAGFKRQSENKMVFRMRLNLYKDTIYLSLKINPSSEDDSTIEWCVVDANTGLAYNPFYFTVNTCKDWVCEKVERTFDEFVEELDKRQILYREEIN